MAQVLIISEPRPSALHLGLVASGKRTIQSGVRYDKFFDDSEIEWKETDLTKSGTVYDTLKLMRKIVRDTLPQTKAISAELKGHSLESTCNNIWNFLYRNVQYKTDSTTREQLRTPLRTWKDRKSGVDCDCFSIFISSVLTNLKIPHAFRMAGYQGEYQHVYVVVPKDGSSYSSYYTIDPVVNKFDYEEPFNKKFDQKNMTKVTMLNGVDKCDNRPVINRLRKFVDVQQVIERGDVVTAMFLKDNKISYAPGFDDTTQQAVYVVLTPNGPRNIPTIMSKSEAKDLLSTLSAGSATTLPAPTSSTAVQVSQASMVPESVTDAVKKIHWGWWVALGVATSMLLFGDDQNEIKSGLDGVPKKVKKAVKKAKRVLSI